jgi:hypothetical protein
VLGGATLFGTAFGIYVAQPKVTISPLGAPSGNEEETPFSITNDGPVAITNVSVECAVARIVVGGVEHRDNLVGPLLVPSLGVGRQVTFPGCTRAFGEYSGKVASITRAEIAIFVSFSTWLPPWKHRTAQSFVAVRGQDNVLRWYGVERLDSRHRR